MTQNSRLGFQIINTDSELENMTKALEKEEKIAFDLEADSMYHFKERVCLLQIASKKTSAVIDPLQIKDLSLLKPIFANQNIKKISHGSDYDVRSLYRDFGIEINNLFDTQIACKFLGIKKISLEAVLRKKFNVKLDKKYQKKDWSKRPLPVEMIEYAAKDAIYLVPLAKILEDELKKKGRLSWVYEECAYLSKVRANPTNNKPLHSTFKGAGQLDGKALAILEALLQLRLKIAKNKDKPLFKIFSNNSLIKIATMAPVELWHLKQIKVLSNKQINMHGVALIETIANTNMSKNTIPVYQHKKISFKEPSDPIRINALKTCRDFKARELEIEPTLLCNKMLMTWLSAYNPLNIHSLEKIKEMKNWQKEAFGEDVVNVLRSL